MVSLKLIILLLHVWSKTEAQFYTSLSKMEVLVKTQAQVIKNMDPYVNRIINNYNREQVQKFVNHCKIEQVKAEKDVVHYLGNPLNAYTLIKRLTVDLDCIEDTLRQNTGYRKNIMLEYPTQYDLKGAVHGVVTLQAFYKLSVSHLANGTLVAGYNKDKKRFVEYVTPLTASDCFHLGLVKSDSVHTAVAWMKEALKKHKAGCHIICRYTLANIYEEIVQGYYKMGKYNDCLYWVKKRMTLTTHKYDNEAYREFINHLETKNMEARRNSKYIERQADNKTNTQLFTSTFAEQTAEEAFCAEERKVAVSRNLKCYYATDVHPYLKLARIKSEQLHINPDLTIFHEIITDAEIQALQDLAKPRLKESSQTNATGPFRKESQYRITQVAWLSDNTSKVVARLNRRVSHVTGLTVEGDGAEDLQIANYGIAGSYMAHHDFTSDFRKRLASVMFYMTNVEQGGATSFVKLGLTIYPVKNAAIFWKNLHPSGERDYNTMHAACPVLRGSKWVAVKWISLSGQELITPCPKITVHREIIDSRT